QISSLLHTPVKPVCVVRSEHSWDVKIAVVYQQLFLNRVKAPWRRGKKLSAELSLQGKKPACAGLRA
ncbi:hypothetical protein BaRGS_00009785, partial [Batillaria attramentaria]